MSNLDLTIAEIMHGETEVLKIMKGDKQKWPYVPYDSEVEYLQGDGVAYINTGYNIANTLRFVISTNIPVAEGTYWLFGGRGQADANKQALGVSRNSASSFSWRYQAGVIAGPAANTTAQDYVFDNYSTSGPRICMMNNTTATASATASFSTTVKFILFGYNNGGNIVGGLPGLKIYSVKLYSSGTLVCDLIPVRKNGVGYLWDKVSEELFGNVASSGAFTFGNDV